MKDETNTLSDRLLDFAASVIKTMSKIDKSEVGRHVGKQLMRSATSAGANYEEACGAESRRDFIHKLQIVLKELRESLYWLRLLKKTQEALNEIDLLLVEGDQLAKIIGKSIVTARKKTRHRSEN